MKYLDLLPLFALYVLFNLGVVWGIYHLHVSMHQTILPAILIGLLVYVNARSISKILAV